MQVNLNKSCAVSDKVELNRYGGIVSVALLERFESDHGYIEFPETIETCASFS